MQSETAAKLPLKGQCPDYAQARASSVFSSIDNRTVILTRQDFLPDYTADGVLLFIFSSNILDFRRSLSSYLKFDSWQTKTRPDFIASRAASRPENLVPLTLKTAFLMWNWCQRSIFPSPVINNRQICLRFSLNIVNNYGLKRLKDINKNVISMLWIIAEVSQILYYDFMPLIFLNI